MSFVARTYVGLLAAMVWPVAAGAQGVIMERNISLQMARTLADAAIECVKGGQGVTVAVVDRTGQLRAPLRGIELARRKAYTARTFRRSSLDWAKRSEGDLAGQRNLAEVIPLGGGVPIAVGNDVIGAIGVSGSGGQQDDENCAKGAIAKVADQLK